MSQVFRRGLALLEAIGDEPATLSEVARRLDLDKAVVSRLVASAEADGWLVRHEGLLVLGPRSAALGRASGARTFAQVAGEVAHVLAGVTGLDVLVHQFAGGRGHLIAHAVGVGVLPIDGGDVSPFPLFGTATGLALAAQLDDVDLERHLREPLPRYTPRTPEIAEVRVRISAIRAGALAREDGEYAEGFGCVAAVWRHPLAVAPTAISCLGSRDDVSQVEDVTRRALTAAARQGATRASIVAAAAR